MNRIRWLVIFPLFFLFSCSGNKKELKVSEKNIEGYWVSGYLLHNSDLNRTLAAGKQQPGTLLLRLKNEVNGFADTSYRIHGDTLLYRIGIKRTVHHDNFFEEEEFYPFRITFHSKDRLVLMDDVTHEETTFYNISILPIFQDRFKRIAFGEKELIITDSIEISQYSMREEKFYIRTKLPINAAWKNNLDTIISRINWDAALFIQNSNIPKNAIAGEFEIVLNHRPWDAHISIITTKHSGEWEFQSQYVSDPALTVLLNEMKVFKAYCKKENILGIDL